MAAVAGAAAEVAGSCGGCFCGCGSCFCSWGWDWGCWDGCMTGPESGKFCGQDKERAGTNMLDYHFMKASEDVYMQVRTRTRELCKTRQTRTSNIRAL